MNKEGISASQSKGGLSWSQPQAKQNTPGAGKNSPPSAPSPVRPPAEGTPMSPWLMGAFVGGIVIGVLVIWGWFALAPRGDNVSDTQDTGAAQGEPAAANSLAVPPVQDAGFTVAVSAALASTPTWVVVYENREGAPGNALGAALFGSDHQSGSVNLLRGMLSGQTYFVGERRDNGDRIFSLDSDTEVVGQDGKPLLAKFQTR